MSQEDLSATKHVLKLIGLAHDEVETYFKITGRGPVMTGEIALLADVDEERAAQIANNLHEKGLVKQIPGKTPFYMALPPYAALLNQIHHFKETIKTFQQVSPQNLQERFDSMEEHSAKLKKLDDYKTYIQVMKTKLPAQIKTQFDRFESELEQVKRFHDVKRFILNLKEIVPADITKEFGIMETKLETIKSEISNKFETQFRIGALKAMAEKIVSRVVSEQFQEITEYFKTKFVGTTQNMLDQVINQLGSLSDTAGEISTDLGAVFTDIESGLKSTLEDLENRVTGVYDDIIAGIAELKNLFQTEIFETLQNDIINNIINQLDGAEATMQEFWDRSKEASMLSFKDVWFVRSIEGMRAQINEAFLRIKMRIHIIAPKLEDIDLVALSKVKKHVNVRISTNFDLGNPKDVDILNQANQFPNFDIRHYPRENLWSINRDFEEVIVCVVSKDVDLKTIQIAGMGSVLDEHIKLFAGLLEDVWIQSKKIDQIGILPTIKTPSIPVSTQKKYQLKKPEVKLEEPIETIKTTETAVEPTKIDLPVDRLKSSISSPDATLSYQFDSLIKNLEILPGYELAAGLQQLQDELLEKKGFSAVLRQIRIEVTALKSISKILDLSEKDVLLKKINFWRKKLNI
ncbi:MAG: helix-turn-helix domain-containing protein [Promethearchaeota archaeon]